MAHEVTVVIPELFPLPACINCTVRRRKVADIFKSKPPGAKRSAFKSITTECRIAETGIEMKHTFVQNVQLNDEPTSRLIIPGSERHWTAVQCPEYEKHHQPKDGVILYTHE